MIQKFLKLNKQLKIRVYINIGSRLLSTLLFPIIPVFLIQYYDMKIVGLIVSMFTVTSIIGNFIGGSNSGKRIKKDLLVFKAVEIVLLGVMAFAILTQHIWLFIIVLMIFNIISNFRGPLLDVLMLNNITEENKEEVLFISYWFDNISVSLAYILAAIFIKGNMLLVVCIGMVLSIVLLFLIKRGLNVEKGEIQTNKPTSRKKITLSSYLTVFQNGRFLMFLCGTILIMLMEEQTSNYLSIIYQNDFSNSLIQGIQVISVIHFINTFISIAFPLVCSYQIKTKKLYLISVFVYTVGITSFLLTRNVYIIIACAIFYSIGEVLGIGYKQATIFYLVPQGTEATAYFATQKIFTKLPRLFAGICITLFSFIQSSIVIFIFLLVLGMLGGLFVVQSRKNIEGVM